MCVKGAAHAGNNTARRLDRRAAIVSQQSDCRTRACALAYSDLSMFQNTGVAGPSSTPVSDLRHTLGLVYCPSGM